MADKIDKTDTVSTVSSPVTITKAVTTVDKAGKTKPKRLSKSERTHRRRLKQATRKPAAGG